MRDEVWQDSNGSVVKYNLAFINHTLCVKDNGRVLGYDSNHGEHHRHCMGEVEPFAFSNYEDLLSRFIAEVHQLRTRKEEQ